MAACRGWRGPTLLWNRLKGMTGRAWMAAGWTVALAAAANAVAATEVARKAAKEMGMGVLGKGGWRGKKRVDR